MMIRMRLLTSMAEAEMAKLPVAPGAVQVVGEHVSPRRAAIQRFLRYRLAIVGVVVLLGDHDAWPIFAPLLTPWPPNWIDFSTGARQPPSPEHVLGTDVSARDVWARVLYGARTSLHRRFRGGRPVPRDRYRCSGWRPATTAATWTRG